MCVLSFWIVICGLGVGWIRDEWTTV